MLLPQVTTPLKCFCGKVYTSPQDLEEHRRARGHFPSHKCTGLCKHPALAQHDGQTHICGDCGKACERQDILRDHAIATGHCFCSDCDVHFSSRQSWNDHRKSAKHASEFKCCDCDISFNDIHALVAHMESRAHRRPLRPKIAQQQKKHGSLASSSTECKRCKRKFLCSQSLQQHYASLKHKPLSQLECPIGLNCRGSFASPSALLHHLESGRCSSGIHRGEIHQIVDSCDLGIISHSPSASLASIISGLQAHTSVGSDPWALPSDAGSEWSMLTPSSSCVSTGDSLERWSLLEDPEPHLRGGLSLQSTTAQALRCPMCPSRRAAFSTSHSLEQHMESPAHSPKVYKFPSLGQELDMTSNFKRFSTLGGLCQHLESNSCKGGKRALFNCIEYIQAQLIQLGLGEMQLLLPHLLM
jgi:hypothetical protein